MNPIEWLQTMPGKRLMAYVYGWGAMIVIIGAMFKIQHWPGAGPMLVTGLSVEAIIFFLSAFEPPHAETDWSLVWPQLAHGHDDDIDELEYRKEPVYYLSQRRYIASQYNNSYDSDKRLLLREKDNIDYRYEVIRKLGKGAFFLLSK